MKPSKMDPTIQQPHDQAVVHRERSGSQSVPVVVIGSVVLVLATGALMVSRAEARINKVALNSRPQPVAVARAEHDEYRASRNYGGTFASWFEAGIGPQYLSAYVDTVLVRPGAVVRRGDILATLDCRNASVAAQAVNMEARAIAAQQKAIADEAARVQSMLNGGFVSVDLAEQTAAHSAEQEAQLAAQKAKLAQTSLTVNDCTLRAPFDGEIATRAFDPGAFVRPGTALVTLVDRSTVRIVADAPESDFDMLKPGMPVHVQVYATKKDVTGKISRRAPGTFRETRTVHFEVDVPDPTRDIPTNTTGEIHIEASVAIPSTVVPLYAAEVRGDLANVFIVKGETVHRVAFHVVGEIGGRLFVDPSLMPGTAIVLQGRELLEDGDRVATAVLSQATSVNKTDSMPVGGSK